VEKRILIFGNGQIAHFYENFYKDKNVEMRIAQTDVTDLEEVRTAIEDFKPTVVINTAAKTNLEWCGNNRLEAFNVNVLGAGNIAKACDEAGVYFIHFSSGCIFSSVDGKDEKTEESLPNPSSYYGWTKVWSEEIVAFERSTGFKYLILRPRQPVSAQVNHKNMLVKMLTFSKFVDTPNSGTVIEDLMEWTDQIIDKQITGVLHVANSGWTTPYNIGLMIKEYILPNLEPEKIEKAELDKMTPNTRVDTVLGIQKLESLGIAVTPYEQRLREIIQKLGENINSMDKETLREQLESTAAASRQRTVLNDVYESLYQ
jgi:dTDP-4-dehydrorhamnose reductase